MRTRRVALGIVLAVGLVAARVTLLPAAEGPYHQARLITIGGEGGWDYLSVDAAARRLYVSHATKVIVIDIDKDVVVGEIGPVGGVHGLAVAPDLGRGFASAGQENKVAIVDLKTLQIVSKVDTGQNPDSVLYEPGHQEVYAFNGRSNSATVFDAKTGEVRATIALPGKPEFAVVDVKAGRIYNNIEDQNVVVAIDTGAHAVAATWPITPGESATGLAIDLARHRLFAICGNKLMVMMDSVTGKVLGSVPIGAGVDAAAFDPGTGLVFASGGDGTLTVARVDEKGAFAVVQTLATPPRSRTMTLDPKTHKLYASSAEFGTPVPGPDGRMGRAPMVAGSFKVVVFEMKEAAGR